MQDFLEEAPMSWDALVKKTFRKKEEILPMQMAEVSESTRGSLVSTVSVWNLKVLSYTRRQWNVRSVLGCILVWSQSACSLVEQLTG